MPPDVEYDKVSALFFRIGTYDLGVIREQKSYDGLSIAKGDVVLDIGGNIGAFCRRAISKGAQRVVSIEPAPDNVKMWHLNNAVASHCSLIEAAIVGDAVALVEEQRPFYLNEAGTNKATHSSVPVKGRRVIMVDTIGWSEALKSDDFTIVKIDIEGAEYGLPVWDLPSTVRALAIEFHYGKKRWKDTALEMHKRLVEGGWVPEKPYDRISKRPRAMLMVYRRLSVDTKREG